MDQTGTGGNETPSTAHAANVDTGPLDLGDNHVTGDLEGDITCNVSKAS